MKKTKIYTLLSLALVLVVAVTLMINNKIVAHASTISPEKIVINGSYQQEFAPDTAYITMGVIDERAVPTGEIQTLEYVNTNLDQVLDTLNQNGILKEDISTMELNMPLDMFHYMRANSNAMVTNMVEFKTTNIENLNSLISTLESNNASIKSIRYSLEDTTNQYASILRGAIENAQQKLDALDTGATYNIVEVFEDGCFSPSMYSNCCFERSGDILTDGGITIGGNVRVVFEKIA